MSTPPISTSLSQPRTLPTAPARRPPEMLAVLESVARFGEARHEVLVSNLANVDTPTYRVRDLPVADFQAALARLVAGETSGSAEAPLPPELFAAREVPANITFHDGANRSVEQTVMQLNKNALLQQFVLTAMSSQLRMLETAISERVA